MPSFGRFLPRSRPCFWLVASLLSGPVLALEREPLVPFVDLSSIDAPVDSDRPRAVPAPVELDWTIGRIVVRRKNVFATGTDADQRFPYALANKLHVVTREQFVRDELLFREGDLYDPQVIVESERVLRARPIFRYVRVTPQPPVNGVVDVLVETEDVWTTAVQVSYGTAGGESFYRAGILEQNFLGTGKVVGGFVRQDIDRFVRGVSYRDPRFFSTRWTFFTGYGKDEKGREWVTSLERPYYSVLVPHSEGGEIRLLEDEDRLFENGDEVATFRHKTDDLRLFASRALSRRHERVRRVSVAHLREEDEFSDVRGIRRPALPGRRVVSAVVAGFEFQNLDYVKRRGVLTFDRDEDINRGWEWRVEAGPSLETLGATRDGSVGRFQVKRIFEPRAGHLWFNHADLDGRYDGGRIRDGVLRIRSQYFLVGWRPEHTASLRVHLIGSRHLDPENQFLLGGDSGLRGYKVRQLSGSKSALFTLENRRVVLYDWLHLVTVGWAVFADAGAAWDAHQSPRFNDFLSDVGAGIRFAPSRSVDPGLIRLDLAYALQDNDRSSRFVVNIGADVHFGQRRGRKFDQ